MAQRLADLIPKEEITALDTVHYTCEVIEAIDAVLTIATTGGAAIGDVGALTALAERVGGETLVAGMEAVGVALEGTLTIAAPLAAVVGEFAALGAGYAEALNDISEDNATRGFALGVVLAVDGRRPSEVLGEAELWSPFVPPNPFIDAAAGVALHAHQIGLVAGMAQGRSLTQAQRRNFWTDLIARDRGSFVSWDRQDRPANAFYADVAVVFRREHLE